MNDDYLFPFYQGIRGLVVTRAWEVGTQEKLRRQRARVTQLVWVAKSELTAYGTKAGTWKTVGLK